MPILEFDAAGVRKLVEHAKSSPEHRSLYSAEKAQAPCLWLVGDNGVYLMSNGTPHLRNAEGNSFVVYAKGCDPRDDADWWDAKGDLYGGDDGADELTFLAGIEARLAAGATVIRLSLSEQSIELL